MPSILIGIYAMKINDGSKNLTRSIGYRSWPKQQEPIVSAAQQLLWKGKYPVS